MSEEEIELTDAEIALASAPIGEDAQLESTDAEEETVEETAEVLEEEVVEEDETEEEERVEVEEEVQAETPESDIGISEEDYTLGQSYGLSKEEVDDLGSRELIEKFGRIQSRQAMDTASQTPQETKQEEPKEEAKQEAEPETDAWDISKIDLDEYDDVTRSAFTAIDQLQKKIAGLESRNQQLEQTQNNGAIQEFNAKLDSSDPEFFGKDGQLSKEQMDRRMKMAETIDMITAGLSSQGKKIPNLDTLIRDANALAFRDRAEEKRKSEGKKRLKKQAARRQSSGSRVKKQAKAPAPYDSEEAEIQRILAETDEAYQRMLEEN